MAKEKKEEPKICPLSFAAANPVFCRKEECAWWYYGRLSGGGPIIERCSILRIAEALK